MKYPIGIQTFEEIITGGYIYVDKTELIYNLVDSGKYYFLSRPRRFGKSLLVTTLESYFLGKKELFKGLYIYDNEKDWVEYPVFRLDFTGETYTDEEALKSVINKFLTEKESLYGANEAETTFGLRFDGVVTRAFNQTGKKVVILIDEYDKPLTDTIGMPDIQEKNRNILQSIYSVLKKSDRYIRFAFLTGVTPYGKLGIFSAANNPEDISILDDYNSICGITESELKGYFDDEIQTFADKMNVSKGQMYELLKQMYDGYHFSVKKEDIYNPFSLLNALKSKQLNNFWFATGTPTYLAKMLKAKNFDLTKLTNTLLASSESIASFGNGESNITAALYQSGYLTIKDYDREDDVYVLEFPNEEVSNGFVKYLAVEFAQKDVDEWDSDIIQLKRFLKSDNVNAFMTQIKLILSQIPFENKEPDMVELHFRNMLYLMIRSTGHKVQIEYPVLGGRIDVFFQTEKYAYIIECKRNESAQTALSQISEKKYAEKISTLNKKMIKIGVNFSKEERNITEWVVEE